MIYEFNGQVQSEIDNMQASLLLMVAVRNAKVGNSEEINIV